MSWTLSVLVVASGVGAIDALYFHMYRYRLYAQPASVWEQVSHTVRGGAFLTIVALLALAPTDATRQAILGLVVLDIANTVVDVLLERASRAPLGGLSTPEYLLHVLGSFLMGTVAATYWWETRVTPGLVHASSALGEWLIRCMLVSGGSLLSLELGLFIRAILQRRARALTTA